MSRLYSVWAIWLSLFLLAATAGRAAAPRYVDENQLIEQVIDLIDRRLAIMPEVAALKFARKQPIADPEREREVIASSVSSATARKLDPDAADAFFSIQITMARAIQEQRFALWQAGPARPPVARDLVKVLRPELDALGREMLPALYLASSALVELPTADLTARLARLRRHEGITESHLAELARALGRFKITAAGDHGALEYLGVMRVGTTGDYAPFSDDTGGTLRGFDIDLFQKLALAWGIKVVFVRTTWATLMSDLARNRFDFAASGISITDERRRVAHFSAPYYFDGKTPIARRADAARFSTIEQIDRPGVRVIVNPGGTNERFVREHIKQATIIVHPDNRTIFAEIVAGRADVMITDGIEVRLQTARHPELAGTRSEPFTRTGKAVLLHKGYFSDTHINASLAILAEDADDISKYYGPLIEQTAATRK